MKTKAHITPPVPPDEIDRLRELEELAILDSEPEKEFDRLVQLGASVHQETPRWTTMLDPEGNEFCVLGP